MATTPGGLPYPLGTDKVVDGDDAIHALATAQDDFNRTYYSPLGNLNAITAVATGLVAISVPPGYYDLFFSGVCDWSISGTARYFFTVYSGGTVLQTWQSFISATSGTVVSVGQWVNLGVAVNTYVQVTVYVTGVTGGSANVNQARLIGRRSFPTAA